MNEINGVYRLLEGSASHPTDQAAKPGFMLGEFDVQIYFNKLLNRY